MVSDPTRASAFAVRGGTALHTLVLPAPLRSSDNRDLVQVTPGPLGTVVTARRRRLDPRLGPSAFERSPIPHSVIYEATRELQKVLKAEARLPPVRYQLALAHLQDRAAKLPDSPQIHYHPGMAAAAAGDKVAARQSLAIAAAAPTPFPDRDEARKALAALR